MDYDERSLLKNFQYMDNSAEDLVPEAVKEHAKKLYKRISDNENKRGAKKHSNMAACVYFASEGRNCATDIEAISSNFNIKKRNSRRAVISTGSSCLKRNLNITPK